MAVTHVRPKGPFLSAIYFLCDLGFANIPCVPLTQLSNAIRV